MKTYSPKIQFTKNSRGVYSIDPSLGCSHGMAQGERGCYDDCYSARIAKLYGYDFNTTVLRNFDSVSHLEKTRAMFNSAKLPFVRMGTMGDPSEDWAHTLSICGKLQHDPQLSLFERRPKEIVIITKHWNILTDKQMDDMSKLNICVNTSISAIDDSDQLSMRIEQYERLKACSRSILRIVSFDFSRDNERGNKYATLQDSLFNKYDLLDTVFRANPKNRLITDGVIKVHKTKFLGKGSYMSKFNKKAYIGRCENCLEMCGVTM